MVGLLSIRTVFPRRGGRVWYDDQRGAPMMWSATPSALWINERNALTVELKACGEIAGIENAAVQQGKPVHMIECRLASWTFGEPAFIAVKYPSAAEPYVRLGDRSRSMETLV
jgi:hypothetical protein